MERLGHVSCKLGSIYKSLPEYCDFLNYGVPGEHNHLERMQKRRMKVIQKARKFDLKRKMKTVAVI